MQKGDIVLIQFPFSDLSGNKKRPALVLVGRELDITVAFISTQLKWKEPTDILLKPTNENGLKRDSIIRLAKLATIDKGLALGLIGRVDKHNIQAINRNLIEIFKL
ncbi:MAG: type II toxin-antitoxin system PemK/MazF family toxin [Bacteroidales bacterium]|nr:type II toxin-antitoxin system PemK/MazF family toxin [Bacteroidales bacterium]